MLAVDSVHVLDVSYNSLGGSGLLGFLGWVCPAQIVTLNLGATTASGDSSVAHELIQMFTEKEFNRLTTLNLSDCKLRDEDIWSLLKYVTHVL